MRVVTIANHEAGINTGLPAAIPTDGHDFPAAVVAGGMGAGSGQRGGDAGDGGGFGVVALPVGAYSIRAGRVRWHPAVSVNLLVVAATAIGVTWLVSRSRTAQARTVRHRS